MRELHAGQEDLPPGACRGTQRRPGRCSAAPLGKGRGLEKLQPRAERRRSGDLDGVPHPCWEGHLRKNENKMSNSDTRTCTKICEDVMPPLQKFHRLNSRRLVYPYEGSRSSMQGPPTRDSGGSVEGGRTRTRSLESQPRSRPAEQPLQSHPAGAFATGGVKPPSVGADAAEDLAGSEPGPRVGVPDRWQPSTRGEHDRWARRWHEDRADQARRGVPDREHVPSPPDTGRGFRSAPNGSNPLEQRSSSTYCAASCPSPSLHV